MKIMFDGYEVEIKAKYTAGGLIEGKRMNQSDTHNLLTSICLWASKAADMYEKEGYKASAERCDRASDDIYMRLLADGHHRW